MPPKVYVPAYPAGDFRAMPALGAGHAALKWVTSFPGNPERGLPTVMGLVLVSDASNGCSRRFSTRAPSRRCAPARRRYSLRRRSGVPDAGSAAVVGAGVNGRAAARTFLARGRDVLIWDVDPARSEAAAVELGAQVAGSREEALAADLVVTMTPGREALLHRGHAPPGPARQPDGRGRAGQGGDRGRGAAANARLLRRLGAGEPQRRARTRGRGGSDHARARDRARRRARRDGPGRQSDDEITTFDSTGLAIQDLAVALAALEQAEGLDLPTIEL